MNSRHLIVLVLGFSLVAHPVFAADKLTQKVENARLAYRELLQEPDRVVPRRLLDDAECIAVIPNVIRGAFWVGGRSGKGILTCRSEEGVWSPPIFVKLWGASFGLQIGGEATDLVLFLMTERSVKALLKTGLKFGANASIAAGPQGRSAEVSTDPTLRAEIYSYAKSRGLFAGVAVNGAHLSPHKKWNQSYYGDDVWAKGLLFDHDGATVPTAAQELIAELP